MKTTAVIERLRQYGQFNYIIREEEYQDLKEIKDVYCDYEWCKDSSEGWIRHEAQLLLNSIHHTDSTMGRKRK